jgi:type IV secretory pathway VirB2 component (pilin)
MRVSKSFGSSLVRVKASSGAVCRSFGRALPALAFALMAVAFSALPSHATDPVDTTALQSFVTSGADQLKATIPVIAMAALGIMVLAVGLKVAMKWLKQNFKSA